MVLWHIDSFWPCSTNLINFYRLKFIEIEFNSSSLLLCVIALYEIKLPLLVCSMGALIHAITALTTDCTVPDCTVPDESKTRLSTCG